VRVSGRGWMPAANSRRERLKPFFAVCGTGGPSECGVELRQAIALEPEGCGCREWGGGRHPRMALDGYARRVKRKQHRAALNEADNRVRTRGCEPPAPPPSPPPILHSTRTHPSGRQLGGEPHVRSLQAQVQVIAHPRHHLLRRGQHLRHAPAAGVARPRVVRRCRHRRRLHHLWRVNRDRLLAAHHTRGRHHVVALACRVGAHRHRHSRRREGNHAQHL
jgi:hypothetical protein